MSRKKKSGNKKVSTESKLNLVTAILNLVIALILLYEKFTSRKARGAIPSLLDHNRMLAQCQIHMLVYILCAVSITLSVFSIVISIRNRK